jgi:hypothetical protein
VTSEKEEDEERSRDEKPKLHRSSRRRSSVTSEKEEDEERSRDEKPKLHKSSRRRNSVTKQFLDDSVAGSSMADDSWSLGSLSFMGRKNKADRNEKNRYLPKKSRSDAMEDNDEDSSSASRAKTTRSDIKKSKVKRAKAAPQTIQEDWSEVSDVTSLHNQLEGKSIKTSDSTMEDSIPEIRMSPSSQVLGRPTRKGDKNAPMIEFIEKEKKWIIVNQTSTSGISKFEKVVLTIHVFDTQQHVYIGNCHGVSIQIHGKKANAILIDSCSHLNVVFGSVVGTCEVVNSKKVALETIGLCPTFALDKTDAITVWLSKESMNVSSFVTSKCTDVNISIPEGDDEDDGDRKEVSLPDQFVHKFHYGEVKSVASFDNW